MNKWVNYSVILNGVSMPQQVWAQKNEQLQRKLSKMLSCPQENVFIVYGPKTGLYMTDLNPLNWITPTGNFLAFNCPRDALPLMSAHNENFPEIAVIDVKVVINQELRTVQAKTVDEFLEVLSREAGCSPRLVQFYNCEGKQYNLHKPNKVFTMKKFTKYPFYYATGPRTR